MPQVMKLNTIRVIYIILQIPLIRFHIINVGAVQYHMDVVQNYHHPNEEDAHRWALGHVAHFFLIRK